MRKKYDRCAHVRNVYGYKVGERYYAKCFNCGLEFEGPNSLWKHLNGRATMVPSRVPKWVKEAVKVGLCLDKHLSDSVRLIQDRVERCGFQSDGREIANENQAVSLLCEIFLQSKKNGWNIQEAFAKKVSLKNAEHA